MTTTDVAPVIPMIGSVISEIRDVETTGSLTRLAGLAVPYNKSADVGPFTEEFTPGAFTQSIQANGDKLPLLMFHNDRGFPIGVSEQWRDTDEGLFGVWRLADHEDAQQAARMARDGMLNYLSVRFQQNPGRFDFLNGRDKPHFRRRSARLLETSLTTTPVYVDSAVSWVRQQAKPEATPQRDQWRTWLDQIRQASS